LAKKRAIPQSVFPALGAYVGPDIVAGILATGLTLDRRVRLFIDVGTNSEIVLGSSAKTLATAAPAGPAFEAAQIRCGMRAADGAIEGVKIVGDEVELTVIGDVAPVGLCGSGLVDAVAQLVGAGMLDHSGRFVLEASERFGKIGEENVFYLSDDVFLSQRDVRELQFAKASIATGWNLLCRRWAPTTTPTAPSHRRRSCRLHLTVWTVRASTCWSMTPAQRRIRIPTWPAESWCGTRPAPMTIRRTSRGPLGAPAWRSHVTAKT
jgi:hypothetical protein